MYDILYIFFKNIFYEEKLIFSSTNIKYEKISQTICVIYVKNVVYRVDFNVFFNNIFMEVFRCNFDDPLIQHV